MKKPKPVKPVEKKVEEHSLFDDLTELHSRVTIAAHRYFNTLSSPKAAAVYYNAIADLYDFFDATPVLHLLRDIGKEMEKGNEYLTERYPALKSKKTKR